MNTIDLIKYLYYCEVTEMPLCMTGKCPVAGICNDYDLKHIDLSVHYAEGEV